MYDVINAILKFLRIDLFNENDYQLFDNWIKALTLCIRNSYIQWFAFVATIKFQLKTKKKSCEYLEEYPLTWWDIKNGNSVWIIITTNKRIYENNQWVGKRTKTKRDNIHQKVVVCRLSIGVGTCACTNTPSLTKSYKSQNQCVYYHVYIAAYSLKSPVHLHSGERLFSRFLPFSLSYILYRAFRFDVASVRCIYTI